VRVALGPATVPSDSDLDHRREPAIAPLRVPVAGS
jgi:hypothetical protein